MNFKKQAIVAAAILAVAGAANAKLYSSANTGDGQNSSLVFLGLDAVSQKSVVVDLGIRALDFLPTGIPTGNFVMDGGAEVGGLAHSANPLTSAAGTTLTWNFATSTFSVNGVAQSTSLAGNAINWSQFNSFKDATTTANTKWGVIGGGIDSFNTDASLDPDGIGALASNALLATSAVGGSIAMGTGQVNSGVAFMNNLLVANSVVTGNNVVGTAGAGVQAIGQSGYIPTIFGSTGTFNGAIPFSAFGNVGTAQQFSYGGGAEQNQGTGTTGNAPVALYAGKFNFNGTSLSYTVPGAVTPSVPEAESFALALAGLAAIAFAARRRQA
jgi:hypothetical protein